MGLHRELAERFIEQFTGYAGCHMNIMNEKGVIIASSDPKRIGQFHDVAYRILNGSEDIVRTDEASQYPSVQPGVNMAIFLEGKKVGVLGLTGAPDKLLQLGQIMKLSMETMLRYESGQQRITRRRSEKERFIRQLIYDRGVSAGQLRSIAAALGYTQDHPRIAILCLCAGQSPEHLLQRLKKSRRHSREDISLVLDGGHFIVYKCIRQQGEALPVACRQEVELYLADLIGETEKEDVQFRFFIGSLQKEFNQYCHAFSHCRWLEEHMYDGVIQSGGKNSEKCRIVYFYDHCDLYMRSLLPQSELYRMYSSLALCYDEEWREQYIELMGSLMKTSYRLQETADDLYIHKNTVQYRLNKLRHSFGMNPLDCASDRYFMEGLYLYLKNM